MFNLTPQERRVILFLSAMALVGLGISFLTKSCSKVKTLTQINAEIFKVDLNKADKDALMSVSGIGEKLAQRIIEYREARNGFQDIAELKSIKGITDFRFEKIKDSLYVKPYKRGAK